MKLLVQPYNSGASAYNAEDEETNFRTYTLDHEFNEPARAVITIADKDGSMLRKYNASNGAVGGAVADDGGVETDETTEANEDTADDMTLTPAAPVSGDAFYVGFKRPFSAILLNVSTAADCDSFTIQWEYSTGSDNWSALSGITDSTNNYRTAGINTIKWTVPSDWATDEVGSISGLYWARGRYLSSIGFVSSPKGQQVWIEGTYLGVGKVTIEDPTGTDLFFGRIVRVTGDYTSRTVTLECRDWLDQLDEEQITYDMREDLDSDNDTGLQGLRESTLHADPDNATIVDVAYNDGAGNYYLYDDARSWNADEFNGKYVILGSGMAGKKTWRFFPYQATVSDGVTGDGDPDDLWFDDITEAVMFKNDDWTVDYDFRVYLGHDDPSNFYVHSSITGMRIICTHKVTVIPSTNHAHVQIYENDGPSYLDLEHLAELDTFTQDAHEVDLTNLPNIVDSDGIVKVRYDVDRAGGNATLTLRYLVLEVEVETTGYSTAVTINDTLDLNAHGGKVNCLEVATDMTAAATRVWEAVPYCIAKPIYLHIESATGPVLSGDNIVTLTCGDAQVEDTSGISTRQYKEKTRLFIWQDLARQDKAVFWLTLGTATVTYKQTFGADTQQLTDGDVLDWRSMYDYNQMVNEYHIYGARIGDYEIYQSVTNAASATKYKATRTKIERRAGVVSDYEAKELATALAARDAELSQMVSCTIAGNTATAAHATTIKLGEIVEITSSYLWATAAKDYIVTRFAYDNAAHQTYLTLHPKVSIGLQEIDVAHKRGAKLKNAMDRAEEDKYIPSPITHKVS